MNDEAPEEHWLGQMRKADHADYETNREMLWDFMPTSTILDRQRYLKFLTEEADDSWVNCLWCKKGEHVTCQQDLNFGCRCFRDDHTEEF